MFKEIQQLKKLTLKDEIKLLHSIKYDKYLLHFYICILKKMKIIINAYLYFKQRKTSVYVSSCSCYVITDKYFTIFILGD